jgi:hypothetical protein
LEKVDRWNPIRTSAIQSRSRPMRFLGFSNHEKGAPRQEISKWSTVCSTFSRRGWSVVRSASLAEGGTSKKRPSPHLHKISTRSNKVSPRTLQTAFVDLILNWPGSIILYATFLFQTPAQPATNECLVYFPNYNTFSLSRWGYLADQEIPFFMQPESYHHYHHHHHHHFTQEIIQFKYPLPVGLLYYTIMYT